MALLSGPSLFPLEKLDGPHGAGHDDGLDDEAESKLL
jgi:hypothetical protein